MSTSVPPHVSDVPRAVLLTQDFPNHRPLHRSAKRKTALRLDATKPSNRLADLTCINWIAVFNARLKQKRAANVVQFLWFHNGIVAGNGYRRESNR